MLNLRRNTYVNDLEKAFEPVSLSNLKIFSVDFSALDSMF